MGRVVGGGPSVCPPSVPHRSMGQPHSSALQGRAVGRGSLGFAMGPPHGAAVEEDLPHKQRIAGGRRRVGEDQQRIPRVLWGDRGRGVGHGPMGCGAMGRGCVGCECVGRYGEGYGVGCYGAGMCGVMCGALWGGDVWGRDGQGALGHRYGALWGTDTRHYGGQIWGAVYLYGRYGALWPLWGAVSL